MKYCAKCGAEMVDEAIFCVKCGCAVEDGGIAQSGRSNAQNSAIVTVAKVFMILTLVVWGFYGLILFIAFALLGLAPLGLLGFIPLAWCLPMTIVCFNKTKRGEPIGVGFKVCVLLFVNMVAGILLLCDNNN